ncbi:MAG: glucosaminidase domain-containing protein, partial [Flavobacteriaceae bacterium]|nr:glucosaminidase domain-containing protein [Flavobacteriaceae bacterium]
MKNLILILVFFSLLVSCGSKKTIISSKKEPVKTVAETKPKSKHTPREDIVVEKVPYADDLVYDLKKRKPKLHQSTLDYIEEYNDIAIAEMLRYEIPASITLAQGILESNSGRSRLTVKGNNHFGVKCHRSWKGKRIYHDDDARQE